VTTPESGLQDGGRPRSQQPPETSERRPAGWQRALRWVAWLGLLGLAIWKSQSVSFSGLEFLALAVAIGVSTFLLPGLLLLWYNLIPFFKRGNEFRVEPDGSVAVRAGATWPALLEYEYSDLTADGTTIAFTPPQGQNTLVLPQQRVFSREYGVRLPAKTNAEFFRRRLTGRGFEIDESTVSSGGHFTARRKP
jgi:hypothetical protein